MKVKFENVKKAISIFIEQEIAAKAEGLQKFIFFGASFLVANNAEKIFNSYLENQAISQVIRNLEIMDDENNVDIDKLYEVAKYAIVKSGKVTIANVILNENDVDKFLDIVKSLD